MSKWARCGKVDALTNEDRIARAERARAAYREFIEPALTILKAEYGNRMIDLADETVGQEAKIAKLALAIKISRRVGSHIEAIIADGKEAQAQGDYAAQISKIPEHKRSILGL